MTDKDFLIFGTAIVPFTGYEAITMRGGYYFMLRIFYRKDEHEETRI